MTDFHSKISTPFSSLSGKAWRHTENTEISSILSQDSVVLQAGRRNCASPSLGGASSPPALLSQHFSPSPRENPASSSQP
ncbi:hypothetical protein AV530_012133 [Patagioenas fasciata monilis]|uniref:Uncharacterized protein n=1 Tax=Patagioenas fasciata monilis TaxID=372326 RepID=A0A1V4JV68_PATFA|nr:hypothetical protein AV530_012133 [Patagioenas fasciata monilis]